MQSIKENLIKEFGPFSKHPNKRTIEDINHIMNLTSNVPFLRKITEEKNSDFIHREACKYFKLQYFQRGEFVINFGEMGDEFYIILRGKVGVYMPHKLIKSKNTFTDKEIVRSLTKRFLEPDETIHPEIIKAEEYLKQIFESQLIVQLNILKHVDIKINLKFIKEYGKIEEMKEVSQLKEGDNFGELALINDKPRAASIMCKEFCIMAYLSKSEFSRILGKEALRVLEEKALYLQTLPLFSSIPKTLIMKLSYYFTELFYQKGQSVYSVGNKADFVYFVKSGEFKLSK